MYQVSLFNEYVVSCADGFGVSRGERDMSGDAFGDLELVVNAIVLIVTMRSYLART